MGRIFNSIGGLFQKMWLKCTERLVNKLVLIFSAIIILIILTLTFVSYQIIESISVKNVIDSNANNLRQINKNFESYLAEVDRYSLPQYDYQQVMDAIKDEADFFSARYLQGYVLSQFYSRKDVEGVFLYLTGPKKCLFIFRPFESRGVQVAYEPEAMNRRWFKKLMQSNKNRYIQPLLAKGDTGYDIDPSRCFMAYHRTLINISDRKRIAVVSLFFNPTIRNEILKDVPFNKGEHLFLLDADKRPYYCDDPNFFKAWHAKQYRQTTNSRNNATHISQSGKNLMIGNTSAAEGLHLIKIIPDAEIYRAAKTNRNLDLAVGAVFLIVAILIVGLTSNAITKPIKNLTHKINGFGEGNLQIEARIEGNDEVAQLSNQFNQMVRKINDLINQEYKMKIVEKNAILKAMEAEINPHFLYNALQAISTKALKSGNQDVATMVDALASTFRYCIGGPELVKVRDEIKHIENYLMIQKARFGNRLQVEYTLEDAALDARIPRLSIQTLVENSIKHALETVSTKIAISIAVKTDGPMTVVSVRDDGPGIPEPKLNAIRESFSHDWEYSDSDSIGLKNLNTRLKLIYGDISRIAIQTDAQGTEVSFRVQEGRSGGDVQSVDC